jgi:5-hydroxyisourate hydrolase-like protein (transthyretin family)
MEPVTAGGRFVPILLLLMLVAARDAEACSCMASGPPCQSYFEVQAVFAGTVRSITPIGAPPTWGPSVRVEFEEAIGFRGVDGETQSVVTSVADGASCGYGFKPGERYVVYAYRSKPGEPLRTGICSRTRPIAQAAEDLLFFKTLSGTPGNARVFGSITHSEFNLATRDVRNYGPVPNVRLTLRSAVATFQATTDAAGRYELHGVTPATYQLTVEAPPEFSAADLEKTLQLTDSRGCAEADFVLRFDGRVRGSIRTSTGGPAANVRVQLMPIEFVGTSDLIETIDATTDAAGRFEFSKVTPGRYVLGVDLFRVIDLLPDPNVAFPATYHPGTPDAMRATIIEWKGGERHDLEPMTLPPARRAYQLTGLVTLEDGTPAAGVSVALGDANRKWLDAALPVETDSTGTFSFLVHEGLSYLVSAVYPGRDAQGRRRTPTIVGPFVVTKEPAPLRIVVAARR